MAHHPKPRGYLLTWVALIGLTALTFALAHVDLGPLNSPISFAIAFAKAGLIASIFMHLVAEDFTMRFVLVGALLLVVLMVAVVTLDATTRFPLATPPEAAPFQQSRVGKID